MNISEIIQKTILEKFLRYGNVNFQSVLNQVTGIVRQQGYFEDHTHLEELIRTSLFELETARDEAFHKQTTTDLITFTKIWARNLYESSFGNFQPQPEKRSNPLLLDTSKLSLPVKTRFAPNPSGPLHIGHSRVLTLNDSICRLNQGTMSLRFEDTNPDKIQLEFYQMILDDVEWLIGFEMISEILYQSDRFSIYYEIARDLIKRKLAFVCHCGEIRGKLREQKKICACRTEETISQLEEYDRFLNLEYQPRERVVVLNTDIQNPNPSLRDLVLLRMKTNSKHPRLGQSSGIYPTLNFAVAIDDFLTNISVIVRGKDHIVNEHKQAFVLACLEQSEQPRRTLYLHTGLVRTTRKLKTTTIKEQIQEGQLSGWNAPETDTLQSLRRRKLSPKALRDYWIESGLTQGEIRFDFQRFYRFDARETPTLEKISLSDAKHGQQLELLQPDGSWILLFVDSQYCFEKDKKYRMPGHGSIVIESIAPLQAIVSNPLI